MVKPNIFLKSFISCCLILLQVSTSLGQNLDQSVVQLRIDGIYVCAGTLISPNSVVTAAHCVQNIAPGAILEALGGLSVAGATPVIARARNVYTPQSYNSLTRDMDVAVIRLAQSMAGTNIRPATLCNIGWQHGTALQASVWTITQQNGVNVASTLRRFNFSVFGRFLCQPYYPLQFNTNHMFCGIDYQNNVCFRDRGGPVNVGGQFCGIISFGRQCTNANSPLVFTNVGNQDVLQFINAQLVK